MRATLILILCTIGLSASAQWYRIDLKLKKHERFPLIEQLKDNSIVKIKPATAFSKQRIYGFQFDASQYSIELAEASVMKTAQHNMRFRIYNEASYNFSELAHLYLQQNRFSEAKWYLLQSNIGDATERVIGLLSKLYKIQVNIESFVFRN